MSGDEAQTMLVGSLTPHRVEFTYDPRLAPAGSHAEYAAELLERTVRHVDIDVDGLVDRYLRDVTKGLDARRAEQLSLRTASLINEALSAARVNLHHRLGLDLATTLLPRLERTPVQ